MAGILQWPNLSALKRSCKRIFTVIQNTVEIRGRGVCSHWLNALRSALINSIPTLGCKCGAPNGSRRSLAASALPIIRLCFRHTGPAGSHYIRLPMSEHLKAHVPGATYFYTYRSGLGGWALGKKPSAGMEKTCGKSVGVPSPGEQVDWTMFYCEVVLALCA